MKHYTLEQWKHYVEQDLTDGDRDVYEAHLSTCELCLELYMQALERAADSYPVLIDQAALADKVMETIAARTNAESTVSQFLQPESEHKQKPSETASWLRHPIFHYTVAAAVTLVLMSSGVFQSIADPVGQAKPPSTETAQVETLIEQPSVSKMIMEKTIVMLNSIQSKQERGGIR
jgi:anti-sigma factor RsiW